MGQDTNAREKDMGSFARIEGILLTNVYFNY